MGKIRTSQSGFGTTELVLGLLMVVLVGAAGFIVYKNQNKTPSTSQTPNTTKSDNKKISSSTKPNAPIFNKLLSNWQEYKNDNLGLRFGYPKGWGVLKNAEGDSTELTLNLYTDEYDNSTQNIQGRINLTARSAATFTLSPAKYTVTLKPVGENWIITEVNPASADKYKVGDNYDLQTKYKVNGGTAYLLSSTDEGCTFSRYVMKVKNDYAELSLPALCSADTVSATNRTAYEATIDAVRSSITLY